MVLTACKWHSSALPVLMYPKVHSAPVLKAHHFGLVITKISIGLTTFPCDRITQFRLLSGSGLPHKRP
ncbi:hypothetical protein DK867_00050 [Ochrobactrum sp. POC9]|nr:hypothetical protein DK867_00050 [Ochrobactrum sp. POC9]